MLEEHASYFEQEHDWYLLHDDLEAENHPVYFHEIVERAGRHGLQYDCGDRRHIHAIGSPECCCLAGGKDQRASGGYHRLMLWERSRRQGSSGSLPPYLQRENECLKRM